MATPPASGEPGNQPAAPRRDLLYLSALCLLCFFWRLGTAGLFDFNEGLYAEAAREMALRHDWVAGSVNGVLFFDKPPLAIWLTALSYQLFGYNEFAARLPVALSASALVFLTYWFGARHFSRRTGILAASALALSPLFLGTARQMTMDIHQSLWFAVAMFCFFEGYTASSPEGKRWYYGFWAGCGLAFMAKSVPGLFPLAAAFGYTLVNERFRARAVITRLAEAKPLAGAVILLLIIAPWHIAAFRTYGQLFYQEYWVLHHVALLKGTDFDHAQPFWYYVPALLAGLFPFSVFLIPAAVSSWKNNPDRAEAGEPQASVFVAVWAGVVFVLFTAMKSKLVSYLLPMYPAAALMIGYWLDRQYASDRNPRGLVVGTAVAAGVAAALSIGAGAALWHFTRPGVILRGDFAPAAGAWLIPALIGLTAGAALALAMAVRKRPGNAVMSLTMGCVLFTAISVEVGLKSLDREINFPLRRLAAEAGGLSSAETPLAIHIAGPRRPSVYFYLPDRLLARPLVERGEIEPVREFLHQRRPSYILADRERAERLMRVEADLHVRSYAGKWVLMRAEAATATRHPLSLRPSP